MINNWLQLNFFRLRLRWAGYDLGIVIRKLNLLAPENKITFEGKYLLSTKVLTLLRGLTHPGLTRG